MLKINNSNTKPQK